MNCSGVCATALIRDSSAGTGGGYPNCARFARACETGDDAGVFACYATARGGEPESVGSAGVSETGDQAGYKGVGEGIQGSGNT